MSFDEMHGWQQRLVVTVGSGPEYANLKELVGFLETKTDYKGRL
jgi:hypothetical protein